MNSPVSPGSEAPPRVLGMAGICLMRHGRAVLDDAALDVRQGEIVALMGGRGAGKSSLLAIAAGALRPRHGEVWFGGRNLIDLQRSSLPFVRRNVGYLPARPPLLARESALENVMIAPAARGETHAGARLQAADLLTALGLGDRMDTHVEALSTGAQRLVALARALCGPPALLLLDDPTLGLDARDREAVAGGLLAARERGAAVLTATTDDAFAAALAERGARRVRLENGRVLSPVPALALVSAAPPARAATDQRLRGPYGA